MSSKPSFLTVARLKNKTLVVNYMTSLELKDGAWQVGGLLGASFTDRLGMLCFTFGRWEVMVMSPKHESPVNTRAIVCKNPVTTAEKTLCFSLIRLLFCKLSILWVRQTGKAYKLGAEGENCAAALLGPSHTPTGNYR